MHWGIGESPMHVCVWVARRHVSQEGSFGKTPGWSRSVNRQIIGGEKGQMVGKRPVKHATKGARSPECIIWADCGELIVGQCPEKIAPWRLSRIVQAGSFGATGGTIGARCKSGDATRCA